MRFSGHFVCENGHRSYSFDNVPYDDFLLDAVWDEPCPECSLRLEASVCETHQQAPSEDFERTEELERLDIVSDLLAAEHAALIALVELIDNAAYSYWTYDHMKRLEHLAASTKETFDL